MAGEGIQVLQPGVGYGIVVGIGAFFALLMLAITYLQNRFTAYSTTQAEEFTTASRSVKPGLIAAGIVSSWTWSATLLTSSTFAYEYGICGPMWYGAMGTWQILLFALIAIKIKTHAPGAHTFPEVVRARHGTAAHLIYLFFGWATNMLVGACLVLGGAQCVAALSGMNVYAACFLIPLVVGAYVVAGGLRSTFIADYVHTVVLFVAILAFAFTMYTKDGGIDRFYDLLLQAGETRPIAGNAHGGSYLTFKSNDGLVFAFDLLVSGFSTVWLDQAYWQRAIASRPETSVRAYIAGGLAWYGIPFGFATAMGLGCAALTGRVAFPTYPESLTTAQVGAGLSAPATAIALLGRGGAGLMLLLLFMAVTSSTSAELIAVSSLLTFDVYKTYYRPAASSRELVGVSHGGIVLYALVLAAFCCVLNAVSIDLTWILTVLGVIVGGAAVPVGLVLLWSKMSTVAALASPWIGFAVGLVVWMVVTKTRSGAITIATTGDVTNAVAGNLAACGTGVVMAFVLSLLFPGQWRGGHYAADKTTNGVQAQGNLEVLEGRLEPGVQGQVGKDEAPASRESPTDVEKAAGHNNPNSPADPTDTEPAAIVPTGNAVVDFLEASFTQPLDPEEARKATRLAVGFNIFFLVAVLILVPFSLFGWHGVFTRAGFAGWCVVSLIWVWCSMFICVVWPLLESRATMRSVLKGLVGRSGEEVR